MQFFAGRAGITHKRAAEDTLQNLRIFIQIDFFVILNLNIVSAQTFNAFFHIIPLYFLIKDIISPKTAKTSKPKIITIPQV